MSRQSAVTSVMAKAVIKASKTLLRDFGEIGNLQISLKSPKNFVTSADVNSNNIITDILSKARPDYGIISEENEASNADFNKCEYKWVIDPLDGTLNFMHGLPLWSIAIALYKGSEVIAAVTYLPVLNELFWADKGCGFFLNEKRLYVSKRSKLSDALISCKDIYDENIVKMYSNLAGLRKTGSTTINFAYVAAGRYDAYLCKAPLNVWDAAPGILFIGEAGGCIVDENGTFTRDFNHIALATNIELKNKLIPEQNSKVLALKK